MEVLAAMLITVAVAINLQQDRILHGAAAAAAAHATQLVQVIFLAIEEVANVLRQLQVLWVLLMAVMANILAKLEEQQKTLTELTDVFLHQIVAAAAAALHLMGILAHKHTEFREQMV